MRYNHVVEGQLEELARRYVWWLAPAVALANHAHLLCQIMQLGTWEDIRTAKQRFGEDAFREALRAAPPGVLDERSWNFWHLNLFHREPPPMPTRPLPP